jgi:hypothetical protein
MSAIGDANFMKSFIQFVGAKVSTIEDVKFTESLPKILEWDPLFRWEPYEYIKINREIG